MPCPLLGTWVSWVFGGGHRSSEHFHRCIAGVGAADLLRAIRQAALQGSGTVRQPVNAVCQFAAAVRQLPGTVLDLGRAVGQRRGPLIQRRAVLGQRSGNR